MNDKEGQYMSNNMDLGYEMFVISVNRQRMERAVQS
mgnify:CR=1 FL=1